MKSYMVWEKNLFRLESWSEIVIFKNKHAVNFISDRAYCICK